jgi:hypothetical protein
MSVRRLFIEWSSDFNLRYRPEPSCYAQDPDGALENGHSLKIYSLGRKMAELESDNLQLAEIWNSWIFSFRHLTFLESFLYFSLSKSNYLTASLVAKVANMSECVLSNGDIMLAGETRKSPI